MCTRVEYYIITSIMKRICVALCLSFLLVLFSGATAVCGTGAAAAGQNLSKSYHTVHALQLGSIVSLDKSRKGYVKAANTASAEALLGVVVAADNSLVAIDPNENLVQVVTAGDVKVLVSTINGTIKRGDKVAASPLSGIGMRSGPGSKIVGVALENFDENAEGVEKVQIKDRAGVTHAVKLGSVKVAISVGTDTEGVDELNNSVLQRLAYSLVGHKVSTARLVISVVIAAITLVALVVLLYASIYGSLISIGRNPLARGSVLRGLVFVLLFIIGSGIFATGVIYLILR